MMHELLVEEVIEEGEVVGGRKTSWCLEISYFFAEGMVSLKQQRFL